MKKRFILPIVVMSVFATACTGPVSTVTEAVSDAVTASEDAAAVSADAISDNSAPNDSESEEVHEYVHGDTGYFSLIDEGYATPVKSQQGGTCWVNSASTSMESSYLMANGEEIFIEPLDILDVVFSEDKEEGYFIGQSADAKDIGGWAWQITESLSNGFGEYILEESLDYSACDTETIKEAIRQYGAMNVAVNDSNSGFGTFDGYMTLNDPDTEEFDHEVVLIGWDDNFPKEYFRHEASADGAWLAQNSRSDAWGNGGYYWISYDTPFMEQTIFKITKEYDRVVAYDAGNLGNISTGDTTRTANVFHEPGLLRAVGTYTTANNQKLIIEIYDENMEELLYSQEAVLEINGYQLIKLDTPIEVSDYAIAITYEGKAPTEGETWQDHGVTYATSINPGESYVYVDGSWHDMSDANIMDLLGADSAPNNCCIKAIY